MILAGVVEKKNAFRVLAFAHGGIIRRAEKSSGAVGDGNDEIVRFLQNPMGLHLQLTL